ncbi:hypothetical protein [uncultured Desulfovibrio sp.]|uniref:hypothetical protein n=1 Tax=uncultured Desulfovibrio sp. TaxID=167968 RepID=UPI0003A44649|nr:hypothetical protein [uncultured Desulfovibrio sp.]
MVFWLCGYNHVESGASSFLLPLTGDRSRVFEHALDAVCVRRSEALLRDALRDMKRHW